MRNEVKKKKKEKEKDIEKRATILASINIYYTGDKGYPDRTGGKFPQSVTSDLIRKF